MKPSNLLEEILLEKLSEDDIASVLNELCGEDLDELDF